MVEKGFGVLTIQSICKLVSRDTFVTISSHVSKDVACMMKKLRMLMTMLACMSMFLV